MLRTIHPYATASNTRSGIGIPRTGRTICSALAVTAVALTTLTGCDDAKPARKRAERATAGSAAPAVVTTATPTPEPGTVHPESVSYETAEAAYTGRRYGEAVRMFEAYTTRRPENPWGHYMLGLSAWKAGEPERAERAFAAALERDPRHVKSLLNLARVLLEVGRPQDALAQVTAVLELDPELADGHRLMGRVRAELGEPEEALEAYRQALAFDAEDVWSMNNMGLLLIRQGRFDEALAPLARATQLAGDVATVHNNLGIALERTGHVDQAAEAYRAALAADSGYTKAARSLARVEGRAKGFAVPTVDLIALGESFAAEVLRWREERTAASQAVGDTTASTVPAPDVSKREPGRIPEPER